MTVLKPGFFAPFAHRWLIASKGGTGAGARTAFPDQCLKHSPHSGKKSRRDYLNRQLLLYFMGVAAYFFVKALVK